MTKNLLNQPLFRIAVPPLYGFMMYFLILLLNNSLGMIANTVLTQELFICIILAFLISEPVRLVIVLFEKTLGNELRSSKNLILLFVSVFIASAGITFGAIYFYFTEIENYEFLASFQPQLEKLVMIYSISGLLYTLFYLSIYFLSVKNNRFIRTKLKCSPLLICYC